MVICLPIAQMMFSLLRNFHWFYPLKYFSRFFQSTGLEQYYVILAYIKASVQMQYQRLYVKDFLLGAFAKLQKATVSFVTNNSAPTEGIFVKFDV
jgi:hypothetical protein